MLILHRKKGESLVINKNITVTIIEVSGEKVKLAIDAPKEIPILRTELMTAVEVNKEAVNTNGLSAKDIKSVLGISKNKK